MRKDAWKPNQKISRLVVAKYKNGQSARQLGFEYGVADVTITGFLKRQKVDIRNRSNAKRKWALDENAFNELDEEAFYWIGFLLADGNVYKSPTRSLQLNIGLAEKDVGHLEKFKKFLGCNKPLYFNKGGAFFSVYSNKLCNRLAEFNIVPRKSLVAKVPEICKNNRHFWRGMVDGDGWVSIRADGHPDVGLCGTYDIIENFIQFIGMTRNIRRLKKYLYETRYQGKFGLMICDRFYKDADIYLERKFNLYCQLANR